MNFDSCAECHDPLQKDSRNRPATGPKNKFTSTITMNGSQHTFTHTLLFLLASSILFVGCQKPATPGKAAAPKLAPDDPAAVAALEKAGCSLKKNADGIVTQIAVSATGDISETMKHLAGVPNVTTARFGGPGMNDSGMQFLSGLKSLKRLDLTDCAKVGDGTLKVAGEIPTIEVLILRRTGISDAGLESITKLSSLRAIDLRNTNVTDAGIAHLTGLKKLADVQLEYSKVTDAAVEHLRGLPLKSLNLNYTAVTDGCMPAIGTMTTLESLQMEVARITDVGMAELSKLTHLKRFGCRQANIGVDGIKHLSGLKELTRLELRESTIDDSCLEIISQMPNLTFLDISECKVLKGKTIGELGKLTSLTNLEMSEIKKLKDDNFQSLATLTNLTVLDVSATRITDAAVPTLLKLQRLERLSVAGSQMGDDGIIQLSQLPALKWLDLSRSQPKPETVAALKAARPNLEVIDSAN